MVELIDKYMSEACQNFDLNNKKINAIMEASWRQLEINRTEAELKVMQENGTADDLAYLFEAADNGVIETVVRGIKKIKEIIIQFFNEMKDRILEIVTKKENKDALAEVEKKVKLFPLLGRKKIEVENYNEEAKACSEVRSAFDKLTAKLKGKQSVDTADIENAKKSFLEKHDKLVGIAAAITITLTAAIALAQSMSSDAASVLNANKEAISGKLDDLADLAKHTADTASAKVAQSLANAYSEIAKIGQNDFVRCMSNTLASIKKSIKGFRNTKVDTSMAFEETDDTDNDLNKAIDDASNDVSSNMKTEDSFIDDPIDSVDDDGEPDTDPWDDVMRDLNESCSEFSGCDTKPSNDKILNDLFKSIMSEAQSRSSTIKEPTPTKPVTESAFDILAAQIEKMF